MATDTTTTAPAAPEEIVSTRVLDATPAAVFAAFKDPERLARWWGPAGFTNEFDQCDLRPGGEWRFTMVGPDGTRYANVNKFVEVNEPARIVFDHVSAPVFRMTITLDAEGAGTRIGWRMRFESAGVRDKIAGIVIPANEQNFDRLTAELGRA